MNGAELLALCKDALAAAGEAEAEAFASDSARGFARFAVGDLGQHMDVVEPQVHARVAHGARVAESATTALHEAIARGDDGARQHEFTRIGLTYQKVQVLGTEAENCIGEDLTFVGQTEVKVDVDPSIPETDPTREAKPEPVIERPPVASPFN